MTYGASNLEVAIRAALQVHARRLQPNYLITSLLGTPQLTVGLFGSSEAVAWQQAEIDRILHTQGLMPVDGPAPDSLRHAIIGSIRGLKIRAAVRPTEVEGFVQSLCRVTDGGASLDLVANVPAGIVEAALDTETVEPEIISKLRSELGPGCSLAITCLPPGWKQQVGDVWGPVREDFRLMQGLKHALDPQGLFSPGRFLGGI